MNRDERRQYVLYVVLIAFVIAALVWQIKQAQACKDRGGNPIYFHGTGVVCLAPGMTR